MFRVIAAAVAGGAVSVAFVGSSGAFAALAAAPLGGSAAALLFGAAMLRGNRDAHSTVPRTSDRIRGRN